VEVFQLPSHGEHLIRGTEIEVEVKLRPTVSRPVCRVFGHPSGTLDLIFFSVLVIGALSRKRADL
jgi:hypothetical protein